MFWIIWVIVYLICSLMVSKGCFGHGYLINSLIIMIPLIVVILYELIKKTINSFLDTYIYMILNTIKQYMNCEEYSKVIKFTEEFLSFNKKMDYFDELFLFIKHGEFDQKQQIFELFEDVNLLKMEDIYFKRINEKYRSYKIIHYKDSSMNKIFSDFVFLLFKADKKISKKTVYSASVTCIMMLFLIVISILLRNISVIISCSIVITIISWLIYKRTKNKSFTDNIYFFIFWLVDILIICVLPALKKDIYYSEISILLIGVKVVLSMIFGTKALQMINDGKINMNCVTLKNSLERVDNILIMKIYALSKNFLLWFIMIAVIFFNIVIFSSINYCNGFIYGFTYKEYFFSSVANYFTNSPFIAGSGDVGDIISFTNIVQSVVTFFTNIIFIEKIVEYVLKDNLNIDI